MKIICNTNWINFLCEIFTRLFTKSTCYVSTSQQTLHTGESFVAPKSRLAKAAKASPAPGSFSSKMSNFGGLAWLWGVIVRLNDFRGRLHHVTGKLWEVGIFSSIPPPVARPAATFTTEEIAINLFLIHHTQCKIMTLNTPWTIARFFLIKFSLGFFLWHHFGLNLYLASNIV